MGQTSSDPGETERHLRADGEEVQGRLPVRSSNWWRMAAALGFVLVGHQSLLWFDMLDLQDRWQEEEREVQQFVSELHEVKKTVGYGGTIHRFKNFLLRGESEDRASFLAQMDRLERSLDRMRAASRDDEQTLAALADIAATMELYRGNLQVVASMRAAGSSPDAIDARVRVSDERALLGIESLEDRAAIRRSRIETARARSLAALRRSMLLGTLLVLPLVAVTLLLAVRRRGRLEHAMERARDAAQASEAQLHMAPDGILVVDQDGLIVRVNGAIEELFGYPPGELLGAPLERLIPTEVHGPHRVYVRRFFKAPQRRRMGSESQNLQGVTAQGKRIDVSVSLGFFEAHGEPLAIATVRDVSDSRGVQKRLEKAERRLKLATSSAQLGIWEWDRDTGALHWDDKMFELYGREISTRQLEFSDWADSLHPEDRARSIKEIEEALRGDRDFDTRFRVIHPDQSEVTLRATGVVQFDAHGEARSMTGMNWDVSREVQRDDQLRHAHKMEALGQLTGGIAHDFNNILAAIVGNLESLEEDLSEEPRSFATSARQAALRGAALTNQLLTFARRTSLKPKLIDTGDTLLAMQTWLQRALGERVTVVVEVVEADLPAVALDPVQLEHAILNLAINARDAMAEGGTVRVSVSKAGPAVLGRIHPSDRRKDREHVAVTVSDTGVGIPRSVINRVFDPFFTTKEPGRGTGLGLSMVHGFTSQSQGHVVIDSTPGVGSSVHLVFPATPGARANPDAPSVDPDSEEMPVARPGEHILLAEDDVEVSRVLTRQLAGLGYRITATDGAEAAIEAARGMERPDLLLTDVIMHGSARGDELAITLRETWPDLPVVFISGYSAEGKAPVMGPLETEPCLSKPYTQSELARMVRRQIDRASAEISEEA